MWVFRAILRLVLQIFVVTAIAAVLAWLWTLGSTGTFLFNGRPLHHSMQISFLIFGCLMLLLSMGGNRSTASARRTNWGIFTGVRGYSRLSAPFRARPGDPTINPSAVFLGSAIVLLALAVLV